MSGDIYSRIYNAKTISGLRPGAGDVSIFSQDVQPAYDITYDFGNPNKRWKSIYVNNTFNSGFLSVGGQLSADSATITNSLTTGNVNILNGASIGDINDRAIDVFDLTDDSLLTAPSGGVVDTRTFVTPRLHSTSWIVSPLISTMGFTQVDKFYASRVDDTISRTDSNAAAKFDGSIACAKRVWANNLLADSGIQSFGTLSVSGNTTLSSTLSVIGNTTLSGTLSVNGNMTLSTLTITGSNNIILGNLGIGSSATPEASLHVQGPLPDFTTSNGVLMGIDSSDNTGIQLNSDNLNYIDFSTFGLGFGYRLLHTVSDNSLRFTTSSSPSVPAIFMRDNSQVGIGTTTTTPSRSLTTPSLSVTDQTDLNNLTVSGTLSTPTITSTNQLNIINTSTNTNPIITWLTSPNAVGTNTTSRLGFGLNTNSGMVMTYFRYGGSDSNSANGVAIGNVNVNDQQLFLRRDGYFGINSINPAAMFSLIPAPSSIPNSQSVAGIYMGRDSGNYNVIQLTSSTGSYIDFSNLNVDSNWRLFYDSTLNTLQVQRNNGATTIANFTQECVRILRGLDVIGPSARRINSATYVLSTVDGGAVNWSASLFENPIIHRIHTGSPIPEDILPSATAINTYFTTVYGASNTTFRCIQFQIVCTGTFCNFECGEGTLTITGAAGFAVNVNVCRWVTFWLTSTTSGVYVVQ